MSFGFGVMIAIAAYLIGSVSPALILSKNVAKRDIREYGSGNAGTANMMRTFGWQAGLFTFGLDIIKGALVTLLAQLAGGGWGVFLGAVFVVIGHNWPIYYGFRGGKGIAATMGVLLVMQPIPTLIVFALCVVLIVLTRIMSIASLFGVIVSTIIAIVFYPSDVAHWGAILVLCALAIFCHRKNIARLFKGEENKITFTSSYK